MAEKYQKPMEASIRDTSPQFRGEPTHTQDEQFLTRSMPAMPRPLAPELAYFTRTDTWRVMRMQSELVMGIDKLSDLGASVAIFGSARLKENDPDYAAARKLGQMMAEAGVCGYYRRRAGHYGGGQSGCAGRRRAFDRL